MKDAFSNLQIIDEYFVKFDNQKLYFDFYIPALKIVVEVDGAQHDKFTPFFHGDAVGYKQSKNRDNLKREWSVANNMILVTIKEREVDGLTKEIFLSKIGDSDE